MSESLGLVLAAGDSQRMGQPKALLQCPDGASFLASQVRALRDGGCERVAVVVGRHGEFIRQDAGATPDAWIDNPHPERGQSSSLKLGLRDAAGPVIVTLVDQGPVRSATVRALLDAVEAPWCAACADERPGHPVRFAGAALTRIAQAPPGTNLRDWLLEGLGAQRCVAVDDPAVHTNINTPEAYAAWRAKFRGSHPDSPPDLRRD